MNILITISYYIPNISGLTIYAKNLAEGLTQKGYKVSVLTSDYRKEFKSGSLDRRVKVVRVWTPFLLGRGPIMPTFIFNSFFQVLKAKVVICQLPQFEALVIAFWAKVLCKKLIVTYHCDLAFWPGWINKATVFASYVSHFFTCLMANKIVVNSEDYAKNSKFLSLFKRKLTYIYPPIKLDEIEESIIFGKNEYTYKVGFVGRIAKEKGLEYLLGTIGYLQKYLGKRVAIYIAGPGEEVIGGNHQKELATLLAKYSKYIFLLGTLSDAQLVAFYKMLDVFVLPSVERMESFGMTQVEAMMLGCPVVVNNLPGAREAVLKTGMGEVVNVKNPDEFAKAIAKVIKGRKTYVIHQTVVDKIFNINNTIDSYDKLINV
ncbi:hypothetical protein A2115_02360 [Candidatus Woesebacteria bacterium GWA1_41_8]|jgi:glycosyltransferase involved in cell wall biosynthesis|uniref:Glycosyl transferase family 1 domain-containing protein n=1 Tax=Candidatus Woesebacteria bacterium GWA1_41_8 TaxID=1802471 RepID=A0A1F7WJR8_9BACT|nr:MAG: hypothetical protein A2115_02360 [Candidatus Woesebacteria bacterium GWA1_41_8]